MILAYRMLRLEDDSQFEAGLSYSDLVTKTETKLTKKQRIVYPSPRVQIVELDYLGQRSAKQGLACALFL